MVKKTIFPAEIKVSCIKGANIKILHKDNPCFEDTLYSISGKAKVSGLFWLNFFGLGFFGSTTDAVSGGMWEYNDSNFIIPVERIPNCKAKAPNLDSETSHKIESKDSVTNSKKSNSKTESKTNSKKVDSKNKI